MVDLHVHFPMRLLGEVESRDLGRPRDVLREMLRGAGGRLRAFVLGLAARLLDFRNWQGTWRVDSELLAAGGVRVACSVLYRPFQELDLDEPYGAPPRDAYYGKLIELLEATEHDVLAAGNVVVKRGEDFERARLAGRIAFVHCVEGGFHLGAEDEVAEHVRDLAARGVAYITLAHLFWRRVAATAPAIPFLPDPVYNALFPQRAGVGLTALGEAAVRAMYRERILVDISHMRDDAVDATFALVERLDRDSGANPKDYPVIASHSAFRLGSQDYNVSARTVERIAARGGVVGLIFAQHQLNDGVRRRDTKLLRQSLDVLDRHIAQINRVAGSPDHIAIGTDLDGFIKPTIGGVENAADLGPFAQAVRARWPDFADKLLTDNALRVLRRRFP